MSVLVDGFSSSPMFQQIATTLQAGGATKDSALKKGNAIFQFDIKVSNF